MNIVGYHGTTVYNAKEIIKSGFKIEKCKSRNDHWLGIGIYFFTDVSYAHWWANMREPGVVLSGNIKCDDNKYLDLDNVQEINKFTDKCRYYKKQYPGKYLDKNQYRCAMIELYKNDFDYLVVSKTFVLTKKSTFYKKYVLHLKMINEMGMPLVQRQICVGSESIIYDICIEKGVKVC